MDITKRMLLIVSISLARNDSRILARSSGAGIRSDCASCLYDGSLPSFSFSLNSTLGTARNQTGNWNPLDTHNLLTEVSGGDPNLFFNFILFQTFVIRSHEKSNPGLLDATEVLKLLG
jgi:hypothetical protein